ncbi:MAG: hypothetical protein Q9217_003901 [Psora testacea]
MPLLLGSRTSEEDGVKDWTHTGLPSPKIQDEQLWHEGGEAIVRLPHVEHRKPMLPNDVIQTDPHQQSLSDSFTFAAVSPSALNFSALDQRKPQVNLPPPKEHQDVRGQLRKTKSLGSQRSTTSNQVRPNNQTRLGLTQQPVGGQPQTISSNQLHQPQPKGTMTSPHTQRPSSAGMAFLSSSSILSGGPAACPRPGQRDVFLQPHSGVDHPTLQRGDRMASAESQPTLPQDNERYSSPQPSIAAHLQRANGFDPSNYRVQSASPSQVEWRTWKELSVKILGLPPNVTTKELRECFEKEGTVLSVEIFENTYGERDGGGRIRFRYETSSPSTVMVLSISNIVAAHHQRGHFGNLNIAFLEYLAKATSPYEFTSRTADAPFYTVVR